MRYLVTILFMLCVFKMNAQEVNFGVTGGFNAFQKMKWDRDIHYPPGSYHVYVEDGEGEGLLNKNSAFNAVHFGFLVSAKYKRFSFNLEPQFYYQKSYVTFERPFFVERVIGKRAFRMPAYFTAKFFKGAKSPFLIIGANFIKERNWDFSNPGFNYYFGDYPIYELQFETGDNHFEGMLYDNRWYCNYLIGIGKTGEKWNSSVRFQNKMDITKHDVEANIWQFEITFNYLILSSKDFTKKHFLYED